MPKIKYKYRGTEYDTRQEANDAARDEAKARGKSVKEEKLIHKIRKSDTEQDREIL